MRQRQAYQDYIEMGPGRSLVKLHKSYRQKEAANPYFKAPTRYLATIERWSSRLGWQARLKAEVEQRDADRMSELTKARQEAFNNGVALDFERVKRLREIADKAHQALMDLDFQKAPAYRIDVLTKAAFTAMDDVAKEAGGRAKKADSRTIVITAAREMAKQKGMPESEALEAAERILALKGKN